VNDIWLKFTPEGLQKKLNYWIVNRGITSEYQVGAMKGRRTTYNIFMVKTIIDKYLGRKRVKV
jgi:hypothetical protein